MLDCIHICVFHISKNCFESCLDTSSIPCYLSSFLSIFFFFTQSRHLIDTWWINRESSCLLDSFSTLGGSIELLFLDLMNCCSILDRYLSCRQAFSRHLPRQLPRHLSTPHLSRFTEGSIKASLCNPNLISLDISLDCFLISLPSFLISF